MKRDNIVVTAQCVAGGYEVAYTNAAGGVRSEYPAW